ncbi:SRPBCC family protein [Nocardia vulneris]|uniref:SRPBCC family protein n=1 Tax=Nocardia vulneris TaxID=1141657 RepID=UPI00068C29F6|nr:SRPBCC family protein [Nocardia vulneris]
MNVTEVFREQRPVPPIDESFFGTASLVFDTVHTFAAPPEQVWDIIDSDEMFTWLPAPGVGVVYEGGRRGPGMVREMGSVRKPFRGLWIQREQFWRHQAPHRMNYRAISGTWMYYLLVQQYAEDMTLTPTPEGGTELVWTVATTPRLPFRFVKHFRPLWRLGYRLALGPAINNRLARNRLGVTTSQVEFASRESEVKT